MMKTLAKLGILTVGALLLVPSVAHAQYKYEAGKVLTTYGGAPSGALLRFAPGYGGPQSEEGGAGNEQSHSAWRMLPDGNIEIATVYMSSNLENADADGPWQCKVSVVTVDKITGPALRIDQIQITSGNDNGNADRPCNHPRIATDGNMWFVAYGSDNNNNNQTQPYLVVYDTEFNKVSNRLDLTDNTNNNEGAPDFRLYTRPDGSKGFAYTWYSNNNQRTYSRAATVSADYTQLSRVNNQNTLVAPGNIGRPHMMDLTISGGPVRMLACAAKGDQRPPEDGVKCVLYEPETNTELWGNEELVFESDPGAERYMNMPAVTALPNDDVMFFATISDGRGKNKNNKGTSSSIAKVYHFDRTTDSLSYMAMIEPAGVLHTHSSMCSGTSQDDGVTRATLVEGNISGSGPGRLVQYNYDSATGLINVSDDRVLSAYNADSGKIANIYGENPHDQGRDFYYCTGDVPNPGYGVVGGFQPTVRTFFAVPFAGMIPGDMKNGQFLRLMSGQVDPGSYHPDCETNPTAPDCVTDPTPDPGNPDPTPDPGNDPNTPSPDDGAPNWDHGSSPSLLGCAVATGHADGGFGLLILGFALFTLIALRRRS